MQVLPGVRATLRDWCNHLGSLYPDVRLKKIIEMRGADCGPWRLVSALPALWTGLFYDKQALKEVQLAERASLLWRPMHCMRDGIGPSVHTSLLALTSPGHRNIIP